MLLIQWTKKTNKNTISARMFVFIVVVVVSMKINLFKNKDFSGLALFAD